MRRLHMAADDQRCCPNKQASGREPATYAKVLETEPRALPSAAIDHVRS